MGKMGKYSGLQNNFGLPGFLDKPDSDNSESTVLQYVMVPLFITISSYLFIFQNADECRCDHTFGRYGWVPIEECHSPCSGNKGLCGGNTRNLIWEIKLFNSSSEPKTDSQIKRLNSE